MPFNLESRLFDKNVGGGSLLDIGIYPIFASLSSLGLPKKIDANATFFENGVDASCDMIFHYNNANAYLKSTILEKTKTEAIFTFKEAVITVNTQFHAPSTISIFENGKEEVLDFNYKNIGYNFEIEHFNELIRNNKKESNVMTFEFSKNLIKTLDTVRVVIGLEY